MVDIERDGIQNIEYDVKAIPTPLPDKINDIDVKGDFYDNIIDSAENKTLDLNSINSFSNISRSRDEVYNLLDLMGEDPIVSSALEIYASDTCEPNDQGQIVWAESDDAKVLGAVTSILDALNVDKNSYGWVYSLIKYGDLYLRLFRDSEFNTLSKDLKLKDKEKLNEDVTVKAYSKNDHFAQYMEMIKNPAEVFNLTKFGKSYGYLRTHINSTSKNNNDLNYRSQYSYNFDVGDVDVYEATEFVHACLEDNSDRTEEEVTITDSRDDSINVSYKVKRGQSVLYNSFKIWRELSLLENSVLLNRISKSSIVRTVSVEVGDMEKTEVRTLLARIKSMIEQKSAIKTDTSIQEYLNPGPIENTIYVPVHEGKGAITTSQIGGDVNVGDLTDLDYWATKLYGSLGIPKQFLGFTDDSTGFNGGTSLSLISSRYAKTIKRIQNSYIQAITDAVNLILFDRGLLEYINKFTIRMQAPTTQEEKDRKDNMATYISTIQNIMSLLDEIENPTTKLEILKSLLSNAISDANVITAIQNEIDRLEEEGTPNEVESDELGDFGEGDFEGGSEPLDLGGELGSESSSEAPTEEPESPEESFYSNKGGEILTENDLPSWDELGVSYVDGAK